MNEIVRFPAKLRVVGEPDWATTHPRLYAFERARQQMLERFRELCGSDEVTNSDLLEEPRSTGAGMSAIAVITRDIPMKPDQTPLAGA